MSLSHIFVSCFLLFAEVGELVCLPCSCVFEGKTGQHVVLSNGWMFADNPRKMCVGEKSLIMFSCQNKDIFSLINVALS